jgi:acyl carrier protein
VVTPTYDRIWTPVLETVRTDALDCVQTNLAAVADRLGGAGAHLALGAPLRFETEPGAARVAASLEHRLAAADDLLGLRVEQRWDGVDGPTLRALVAEHGPLYVVADAFSLQWTVLCGRQHTDHTFILAGQNTVVDAYHDDTAWGACRPGVWRIADAELDTGVPSATVLRLAAGPATACQDVLRANAHSLAAAGPAIEEYLVAPSDLVLDIWLLGRSRLLHAAWLERQGLPAAEMAAQARAWQTLASTSYVVLRRSAGGAPASVLDELRELLREDAAIAARLAAGGIRAALVDVVGEVLRIEERAGVAGAALRDLPNYNSLRLVEIVERAEVRLGVRLDDTDLTPQALRDVDSLCAAFERRVRESH